jgi:hypothetical protein
VPPIWLARYIGPSEVAFRSVRQPVPTTGDRPPRLLNRFQVDGGGFAAFHRDVERDLLTFVQASQAGRLDRGNMDENVFATVLRYNEPVAFCGVEPLHSAGSHFLVDAPST